MEAIEKVTTSNAWSTLPAFMTKINKHLPNLDRHSLVDAIEVVPVEELNRRRIFIHSFGKDVMPILLANPAHRKAW